MPRPAVPFASVVVAALEGGRGALAPVRGAVFARSALGEPRHSSVAIPGLMLRFARTMLRARLRGEHRRSPFHGPGGRPVARPRTMGAQERAAAASGGRGASPGA